MDTIVENESRIIDVRDQEISFPPTGSDSNMITDETIPEMPQNIEENNNMVSQPHQENERSQNEISIIPVAEAEALVKQMKENLEISERSLRCAYKKITKNVHYKYLAWFCEGLCVIHGEISANDLYRMTSPENIIDQVRRLYDGDIYEYKNNSNFEKALDFMTQEQINVTLSIKKLKAVLEEYRSNEIFILLDKAEISIISRYLMCRYASAIFSSYFSTPQMIKIRDSPEINRLFMEKLYADNEIKSNAFVKDSIIAATIAERVKKDRNFIKNNQSVLNFLQDKEIKTKVEKKIKQSRIKPSEITDENHNICAVYKARISHNSSIKLIKAVCRELHSELQDLNDELAAYKESFQTTSNNVSKEQWSLYKKVLENVKNIRTLRKEVFDIYKMPQKILSRIDECKSLSVELTVDILSFYTYWNQASIKFYTRQIESQKEMDEIKELIKQLEEKIKS